LQKQQQQQQTEQPAGRSFCHPRSLYVTTVCIAYNNGDYRCRRGCAHARAYPDVLPVYALYARRRLSEDVFL